MTDAFHADEAMPKWFTSRSTEVARILANARLETWTDAQRHTLDLLIVELADYFKSDNPRFKVEPFFKRAHFRYDLKSTTRPTLGGQPWQTTTAPSISQAT